MRKLLTALAISAAVSVGGCNFVSHAAAMGGGIPLTPAELAQHNATLSKLSQPKAKKAPAKQPPVLHRAVVPQPKAAPLPKTVDPVKHKPTMGERFKALIKRWF